MNMEKCPALNTPNSGELSAGDAEAVAPKAPITGFTKPNGPTACV